MGDTCENLLKNKQLMCLYFAAVLFLLLLIIMQLWKVGYYTERMTSGVPQGVHADQPAALFGNNPMYNYHHGGRARYQTGDSAANRANTSGVFGDSVTALDGAETLVNNRGEPDFWTIGDELGAYKRALGAGRFGSALRESREVGRRLESGEGRGGRVSGDMTKAELQAELAALKATRGERRAAAEAGAAKRRGEYFKDWQTDTFKDWQTDEHFGPPFKTESFEDSLQQALAGG